MKRNKSINNKILLKNTIMKIGAFTGWIIGIASALFNNLLSNYKMEIVIGSLSLFLIYYLYSWNKASRLKSISLNINDSKIEILEGDIFGINNELREDRILKVITFNEYFDTQVDDKIISRESLNGKFINNILNGDTNELDYTIENDTYLKRKRREINQNRKSEKKQKYKIGTVLEYKEKYLLTVFSRFNDENKAEITLSEYIEFLVGFWSELDRVYASRIIEIPLLGSGIIRFSNIGNRISNQELLEHMLWSLKISRVKFNYPSKIKIILNCESLDEIDLFRINEIYKNDYLRY